MNGIISEYYTQLVLNNVKIAVNMVLWRYYTIKMDKVWFWSKSPILGKNLASIPGFGQVLILVEIGTIYGYSTLGKA